MSKLNEDLGLGNLCQEGQQWCAGSARKVMQKTRVNDLVRESQGSRKIWKETKSSVS